jgi:alpha-beta hydrolase superfamily lysophospholipase
MNALILVAWGLPVALGLNMPGMRGTYSFPVASYFAAAERVAQRQSEDDSIAVAGATSILMTHGAKTPRAYVLLHGFTDSPKQFEELGKRLFAKGDNVYVPRLPHHSERAWGVRELGNVRPAELIAFGDSTVDIALGLGDSVVVVGLSAGGNIAASIAQSRPDVARAVIIAPAINAGRLSGSVGRKLGFFASLLPDVVRPAKPDSLRPDYVQGISTRGLGQVLQLGDRVRSNAQRAPSQTKQIAFLLNENDRTVSDDASIEVARYWEAGPSLVSVYQFPRELKLPHNTMELTEKGGNLEIVLPVVEALARGMRPPMTANYVFLFSDWLRPRSTK